MVRNIVSLINANYIPNGLFYFTLAKVAKMFGAHRLPPIAWPPAHRRALPPAHVDTPRRNKINFTALINPIAASAPQNYRR